MKMNEFTNGFGALSHGFSAVSMDERKRIEGGMAASTLAGVVAAGAVNDLHLGVWLATPRPPSPGLSAVSFKV
jgi:hypothetical protein